jgi:LCP family protein required for cell wall assembly
LNIKKFFLVFCTTTIALLLIVSAIIFGVLYNSNIGGGKDIDELDKVLPEGKRNILLIGTDKSGMLADVLMIFSLDAKNEEINVISVPRDTKVKIPKYGTYKITESLSLGGENTTVGLVKDVSGIAIHDYIIVNFKAVEDLIDALGGVKYYVPQRMYYKDPEQNLYIDLYEGMQVLNGKKAVDMLRFRSYPMGDITRTEVQRDFIKVLFEQKASVGNLDKVDDLYRVVNKNIKSSISYSEVISLANMVKKMENLKFQNFEFSYTLNDPYVIINLMESLPVIEQYFE